MAFSLSQTDVALHRNFTLRPLADMLENWLEAERERIALWAPIFLGLGIAAWFALPDVRWWAGWIFTCCGVALAAGVARGGGRFARCVMTAALLAGAGCALIWSKALLTGAPPLERPIFSEIEGRVVGVETQQALNRFRLIITPIQPSEGLPSRIRVNVDAEQLPQGVHDGAVIAFRARLMPPAPPAVPGAFDFAQRAYFSGIGATGHVTGAIRVVKPAAQSAEPLRERLALHVRHRLDSPEGAIAVTLATGDRGGISREDEAAMRRSGLAHLLSISGLHVSALIAAAILISYRLLALWPRLALTLPLMLIAAGMGALAGIGYTLVTGAQVPTVRSCIAALLVLGGLAIGREAMSLRLVSVGALLVLLIWPESLIGPSFQMSFAAVAVIIALAETSWFRALTHRRAESWPMRWMRAILALFLTGLAVEIALMPIAMVHFHQAGLLGSLANLVAIPLTTFVIMPAEAAALALDMAGLGGPAWWITGKALSLLLSLAHAVASHPAAVWSLPVGGVAASALMAGGGLWLLLWRTRVRLAGLLLMASGALLMAFTPAPDLLVSGDGRHMALRQADGSLALLRGRAGDYVRGVFSGAAGEGDGTDGAGMSALAETANARCSRDLCSVLMARDGRDWIVVATRSNVSVPWRALVDTCARADIVVSDRRLPIACHPRWLKLDRARLAQTGGIAVYLDGQTWRSVRNPVDRHPWIARQIPASGTSAQR